MDIQRESIEPWVKLLFGASGATWLAFFLNKKLFNARTRKVNAETDSIIIGNFRDLIKIESERTERFRLQAEQVLLDNDALTRKVAELTASVKVFEQAEARRAEEKHEWHKKYLELEIKYLELQRLNTT